MSKKERLAYLQRRLKEKLEARAFFEERMAPCMELLSAFQDAGVTFHITGWIGFEEAWLPHLATEMQDWPYAFDFDPEKNRRSAQRLDSLFEQYPSANALRYVPSLEKIPADISQNPLKVGIGLLEPDDREVYICWLRYAPLIKLKLDDVLKPGGDTIFNFWHGDTVIFPEDLSWLMAYSLEEEWYVGRAVRD